MNRVSSGLIGTASSPPPLKRKHTVDEVSTDQVDDGLARPPESKKATKPVTLPPKILKVILRYLPVVSLLQYAQTSKSARKIAFSVLKEPDYFAKGLLKINPNIFQDAFASLLRQANPSIPKLIEIGRACPASRASVNRVEKFNVHALIFNRIFGDQQTIKVRELKTYDQLEFILARLPDLEGHLSLKSHPGYVLSNLSYYIYSASPETCSLLIDFLVKRYREHLPEIWKGVVKKTSPNRRIILFQTLINCPLLASDKCHFTKAKNYVIGLIKLDRIIYDPLGPLNAEGSLRDHEGNVFVGKFDNGSPLQGRGFLKNMGRFDLYQGSILEGKPFDGRGNYTDPNGNSFSGIFKEGSFSEGSSKVQDEFGGIFDGPFRNGQRQGQQKVTFPNGDIYMGPFVNGEPQENGSYQFADSSTYTGSLHNFRPNGIGKRFYPNGDIDEGMFEDGQLNGAGSIKFANGKVDKGEFKDRKLVGFGIRKYADESLYVGHFKDGKLNGRGIINSPDGSRFEGEFKESQPNGQGTIKLADGSRFEGEFKEGQANGKGIINSPDGSRYEGEFKDDKENGLGVFIDRNGYRYTGIYKDGEADGVHQVLTPEGESSTVEYRAHRPWKGKFRTYLHDGSYKYITYIYGIEISDE